MVLEALKNRGKEDTTEVIIPAEVPVKVKTLTYIMFHIGDNSFDQV